MKRVLYLLCLLLVVKADAQQTVRGRLTDERSKKPLYLATVSIYAAKDTSLITYGLSTTEGDFVLTGVLANLPCKLIVYASGHAVYSKEINISGPGSTELGPISLLPSDEVPVTTAKEQPPVMISQDSIIYTAAGFAHLPGVIREGPLKHLPGIYFHPDGTITAGGKNITQIRMARGGWGYLDLWQ